MNFLTQAYSDVRRDWRLTDVRLLVLALIVAVTAVTSVSFFTDRVDRAMRGEAAAMLGADLVVKSSRPIPAAYPTSAAEFNLASTITTEFPSVTLAGDRSLLVQVKAVGDEYPLRGELEVTNKRGQPSAIAESIPAPGEVWVEDRVLLQVGINPGETLNLGNSTFKVSRIIVFEPDRGGSVFQLAPRLMMNQSDISATGLITPASRATFRLLVAGEAQGLAAYRDALEDQLKPFERIQTVTNGRPEITGALDRASRFMALAAMLTVILSGAAVALAANGFSQREINRVAIMRTLGADRRRLWTNYSLRLFILLIIAALIGSLIGFLAQSVLASLLQNWVQVALPAPSLAPLLTGFGTAALTLAGFALPAVLHLLNTPPMQILRSELTAPPVSIWIMLLLMASTIMMLLAWQAGDWLLASRVFGGIVVALAVIILCAWLMIRLIRLIPVSGGQNWGRGFANLGRFSRRSTLLIATFSVGILTLTLLGGVRGDLMKAWENNVPSDAPNNFLINIQPDELPQLREFFSQRKLSTEKLYPMVRGRLLKINDHNVSDADYESERAKSLVNREFNLSAAANLPSGNSIVEGEWYAADNDKGFSVESGIAQRLGFKLGDQLTFDVAGEKFSTTINSVREVQWDTMQPNFFVMTSMQTIKQLPVTYITSLFVPAENDSFATDLVSEFPGITTLDVKAILVQVRRIIDQASRAVEYVFLFTLLAGVVVLISAIQTQRTERRQEIALLKSLGASTQQIRMAVAAEFALIGGLSGLLGSGLAVLIGWILANQVFDLNYSVSWLQILMATLTGLVCTGLLGLIVVNKMLDAQPIALFQKS